jgi:hypothetical protein
LHDPQRREASAASLLAVYQLRLQAQRDDDTIGLDFLETGILERQARDPVVFRVKVERPWLCLLYRSLWIA